MKELSFEEMMDTMGGTSKVEYCSTLWNLLNGGGYQGDVAWGWSVYARNCVG